MQTLSPEEARRFLEAARGDRFAALYTLALSTGMRQGEMLALRWRDADLEAGTTQVCGSLEQGTLVIAEPKTAGSRRQVTLTRAAVEALRRHRVAQAEERLRAVVWDDRGLVFCTEAGTPVDVRNLVRRSFTPLLEKAGLPRIRFHDLRHTAATLLLGQGTHPKVVADLLGHTRIGTTLDLYSQVTPTMQAQAAATMDAILGT
jgi:integrase